MNKPWATDPSDDPSADILSQGIERADWIVHSREPAGSSCLYFGDSGAENWLSVTSEPNYPLNATDQFSLKVLRRDAVGERTFSTLVSFGPGDGGHDVDLLAAMRASSRGSDSLLRYIPIDVCEAMLKRVVSTVNVPATIPGFLQCDFERDTNFITSALKKMARPPVLYSMLGGTFANLDLGELKFLKWLRDLMEGHDAFLIDVPTAGPDWTVATEPRLFAEAYSPTFRRFLAFGVARCDVEADELLEVRASEILADFDNRLQFVHATNTATGAEEIAVVDKEHQNTVLRFRRYRFDLLLSWIKQQGLTPLYAATSNCTINNRFGMGVILIQAD